MRVLPLDLKDKVEVEGGLFEDKKELPAPTPENIQMLVNKVNELVAALNTVGNYRPKIVKTFKHL